MYYRLKDRTVCPPNGFICRIPVVNVEARTWDFNSAVDWYVKFAAANPTLGLTADRDAAAVIVDQQNARRVARIPGASSYIVQVEGEMLPAAKTSTAPSVKSCCGLKRK